MSNRTSPESKHAVSVLSSRSSSYIYGIDIVRFLSALGVAAFHFSWKTPGAPWHFPFGWLGVPAFFVISGLVIANSAYGSTARRFIEGRFFRLNPAAWCALLLGSVLVGTIGAAAYDRYGILVSLAPRDIFGSFILFSAHHASGAYWTLPIEIAFYSVVALLLAFRRFNNVEMFAALLMAWSSVYLVVLAFNPFGVMHHRRLHVEYGWTTVLLLRHGCYFSLGILIWLMKEKRITGLGIAAFGVGLVVPLCELLDRSRQIYFFLASTEILGMSFSANVFAGMAYGAFLLAVGAILVSVKMNHLFPQGDALHKTVRLLGLTTYPFYLLHESVGGFVLDRTSRLGIAPSLSLVMAFLAIGIVALLVTAWLEPLLRNGLKRGAALFARREALSYKLSRQRLLPNSFHSSVLLRDCAGTYLLDIEALHVY
jgi:exopolysaccharide production protein ExoZ